MFGKKSADITDFLKKRVARNRKSAIIGGINSPIVAVPTAQSFMPRVPTGAFSFSTISKKIIIFN